MNINIGREWAFGGMESHSEILASVLTEKGHNVIMGCWIDGTVTAKATGIPLPARRIRTANSGDIFALLKIVRICLREHIDIIIANHGKDFWPAAIAAKIADARIVFIRHMGSRLKRSTSWLINRYVDRVIAVSGSVKKILSEDGVSPGKIDIVHNGIILEKFTPQAIDRSIVRSELGLGSDDTVVGAVGKLHKGKGVFDLLAAFHGLSEKYPRLKLVFVGDGPERAALERETRKLSVHDRVIFTGVSKDVAKIYAAMDIFALPSTFDEAFGMVLIEAMAMGKPVIGTAVGGIPEIIENGVTGILVSPHDPQALARAIARYIDDADFSRKVSLEGRRMVECKFSDDTMGDNFERILKQLI